MTDIIKEAQELWKEAIDATREQRVQVEQDIAFSDPSDPQQWDEQVKRQRETDPGGARPCLVLDHTGQYVDNVAGTVAKAPPALHVVPVDSKADIKVAEQLDGMFRHIEYSSRAQMHYTVALRSAARTGVGYLIVRPEIVNVALNYQEPRITSEPDPLKVVFDPWCLEIDGKGANFGYLLTSLSVREFERKFGDKAEKKSFEDIDRLKNSDRKDSLVIAEQWEAVEKRANMVCFLTVNGEEDCLPEDEYWQACQDAGIQLQVTRTYTDKVRDIKWRQMSGAEVFEESEYPADQIGIVPVYGYVGNKDGRMTYCGIPRRGMYAQRAYNYHQSEMVSYMGTAPKSPWIASVRAIRGLEQHWDRASLDTRAYLPYNDIDELGAIAAPNRNQQSINLQNHLAGAEQALRDLEASIGMYQANLGAPSNETSRVAIDGRKESGETSTSHFPLNLASSLGQVGRITLQMLPRLIDTKRRQRILGIDMTPGFVQIDPEQEAPHQEMDGGGVSINPTVGQYDARIVVGASYTTQRSQAQAALGEVMRNNPSMTPAIAPLWAMNLDIPNADKLAQVFTAIAPPEVQAVLNPGSDKQPTTADLMHQIEQLKQGLQEAIGHAHDAQADADAAQQKVQELTEADDIAWYNAETNRLKVTGANEAQIQAIVQAMIRDMVNTPGPSLLDEQNENEPIEGPGPDGSMQHEMAEGKPPEPNDQSMPAMANEGEMQ